MFVLLKVDEIIKYYEKTSLPCGSKTKYVYQLGIATTSKKIFEKLNEYRITAEKRKHYPYFAVWDGQAYFDKADLPNNTKTIE